MKAILDHWVGNRSEDTEHTIVSTGELLALLKRLGTNHHTLLSLYHPSKDPDNNHLMIGVFAGMIQAEQGVVVCAHRV